MLWDMRVLKTKKSIAVVGVVALLLALAAVILPGLLTGGTPAASVASAASASATPASGEPLFTDSHGIHVVGTTKIDDRQYNVQVSSRALDRTVDVRVLVPTGYTQDASAHYPALYLFHGTSGRASDWVNFGGAEQTTANKNLIVVMPDAGFNGNGGGWFTDWFDTHTTLGPSKWETFDIDQLVPWVDSSLRTVANRGGRAIAGLSQGGFGSMSYAARHPDMFEAAAAFSGAPDIDRDPALIGPATAVIESTATGLDGVEPDAMFGPRATNEINWSGHDPATLSTNLRGMNLSLFTGEGKPGPYDPPTPNPSSISIEKLTYASTSAFHNHLVEEQIPSSYDDYVNGTHTFPYWARDLREYVDPLTQSFAHPTAPKSISYKSIDASWSQWGWSVSLQRPVRAFSALTDGGPNGFGLQGTGKAAVTTPAAYRPNSAATVRVVGASGRSTMNLTADPGGRLHIPVPLSATPVPGSATVTIHGVPAS